MSRGKLWPWLGGWAYGINTTAAFPDPDPDPGSEGSYSFSNISYYIVLGGFSGVFFFKLIILSDALPHSQVIKFSNKHFGAGRPRWETTQMLRLNKLRITQLSNAFHITPLSNFNKCKKAQGFDTFLFHAGQRPWNTAAFGLSSCTCRYNSEVSALFFSISNFCYFKLPPQYIYSKTVVTPYFVHYMMHQRQSGAFSCNFFGGGS